MTIRPTRGPVPRLLLIILLGLAAGPGPIEHARAQSACTYDLAAVTNLIQTDVEQRPLAGAALLLVKDGQTIYEQAFGSYTINTIVPLASASKWLSASAILSLADDGLLSLDDPVSRFLPNWTGTRGTITIRQLLSHTSGLPGLLDPQPPCLLDTSTTLAACVDQIATLPLVAAPGTQFRYGNVSFHVAGRVAEVASGKSWNTLFQERIKGPLGMLFTTYGMTQNPRPSGSAISRIEEYGNFLRMHLDGGMYGSTRVLSAAAVEEMRRNQIAGATIVYSPSPANPYGLGEFLETWDSHGAATGVAHPGQFGFYPWIDLRRKIYGVFLVYDQLGAVGQPGSIWALVQDVQRMTREVVDAQPCADLDADALLDIYETGDGIYVNPSETGTSRTAADTDGDGFTDGAEVAAGSNPNDPLSGPATVPTLSGSGAGALVIALIALGRRVIRRGRAPRMRRKHDPAGDRRTEGGEAL